jgi:tripartite-type tricarboxylate transporter receptor subunit TctC
MDIAFPVMYPMVKEGKLRALAVTGAERSQLLPDVPTMKELGYPDLTGGNWYGLVAPPNTPAEIAGKLNAAVRKITSSDDIKKAFQDIALVPMTQDSPAAFTTFLKSQMERWGKVVKDAGIEAN